MGQSEATFEGHRLRAILLRDGTAGPIEVRLGRRLLKLVSPESAEGRLLLDEGRVDLVGPDGERLGRIPIEEARGRLRARLESALGAPELRGEKPGGRLGHA